MNQAEFGLFIVYVLATLSAGIGIYTFLNKDKQAFINGAVYIGEAFLIGSTLIVGELMILSLIGLYKAPFLWAAVLSNFIFLLNKDTRAKFSPLVITKYIRFDPPVIIFVILTLIFIFRNCYFLVDIDSHTSYLFTQKLWLSAGTSLTGDIGTNIMVFVPQFDCIPYSLGICLFGQETLFPQLINLFWRLIVIMLIFGYTSFRFGKYFGLAAVMFTLWNDHFFYSGVNRWVLINGAVIGFLFAAAYNFWESRRQNSLFRFALALIFTGQLFANKYQMVYVALLLVMFGIFIQPSLLGKIKEIKNNRKLLYAITIAFFFASLWYFKNFLITGIPMFPILAGKMRVFNWVPESEYAFIRVFGGLKPSLFIKYMNYLFIWPGINAAKYIILTISLAPILFFITVAKRKAASFIIMEFCFWLSVSILSIFGTCLASYWDPRYYRYSIGVLSFTAVLSIYFVLRYVLNIQSKIVITAIVLFLSFWGASNEGYKVIFLRGGLFKIPTFRENINTIFNKIHTDYAIKKFYPETAVALEAIAQNKEKFNKAAWDMGEEVNFPLFLLPDKPMISLWRSSIIRWDSFKNNQSIVNDLKKYGIEWIMVFRDTRLVFMSVEDYAKLAEKYDRYPEKMYFDYNFPAELSRAQR